MPILQHESDISGRLGDPAAALRAMLEALVAAVAKAARAGDHVLVMSNGGFGGVHQKWLEALGSSARGAA